MGFRLVPAALLGALVASLYACSSSDAEPVVNPGAANDVTNAVGDAGVPLPGTPTSSSSVLEHHGSPSRSGLYTDSALTSAVAATVKRDAAFNGAVTGNVYAQPLYVENGPNGAEAFIVATEQNHVTALDGAGTPIWDKTFGAPATSNLPCGNIRPLGVTGTPVIDPASRTIYFDAMTTPDNNRTFKHLIYAISVDDGSTRTGWPIDFDSVLPGASAAHHNQRGALTIVNGTLYVPYGGHYGDCDPYRGTVIGVPLAEPTSATAWTVPAEEGGIWAPGGLASDGTDIFAATGNTTNASGWAGGEALIRLKNGTNFSNQPVDYFAPTNWKALDDSDLDLGGSNPVLVDLPGSAFPHLILAFGKDATLYLVNRDNLGGIGSQLASLKVMNGAIIGAPATYKTTKGTYVAFRSTRSTPVNCPSGGAGNVGVARIVAGSPPRIEMAWCTDEKSLGSPIATTQDGTTAVVWDANDKLWAYDGDTGAKILAGADLGATMQYFNAPIPAKGRIAVALPSKLAVFKP